MTVARRIRYGVTVGLAVVGVAAAGCGSAGPRTHPVAGRVELVGGGAGQLAGHHVEVARADDPTVRAAGVIGPDGRFRLETLAGGKVLPGAWEGEYRARLVLTDEGDGTKKPKLPRRYLDFKSSGLTVRVPADGEVTLTLATK
jgi:hypothetical protein